MNVVIFRDYVWKDWNARRRVYLRSFLQIGHAVKKRGKNMIGAYENFRRVSYAGPDHVGDPVFVPVCLTCGRFVKADGSIFVNELGRFRDDSNAECKKCGRVSMPFDGFF